MKNQTNNWQTKNDELKRKIGKIEKRHLFRINREWQDLNLKLQAWTEAQKLHDEECNQCRQENSSVVHTNSSVIFSQILADTINQALKEFAEEIYKILDTVEFTDEYDYLDFNEKRKEINKLLQEKLGEKGK